jgi:hypothetical protein
MESEQDGVQSDGRRSFSFHTERAEMRWLATMVREPVEPVALRTLCVSKCMMTDSRIHALYPIILNLTHIDLEKSCLTDSGVASLAAAGRRLRHLQVTGARLSLATGSLLCNSPALSASLRSLLIGGTHAMGAREAALVVDACKHLKRLYVWSQMTEQEGKELMDRADARRGLLVLAKARLNDNDVT